MTTRPMISGANGKSKWLAPALAGGLATGAAAYGLTPFVPAAAAIGHYIGNKIKDITGYGDYTIRKNSLMPGYVPSVGNVSAHPGGLTISHKEYIGDVITATTAKDFTITKYELNPSNSKLWEWLAQIACNYEEWVPEGILFYYKSTSGDALSSTDTSLGTVIMATQYNPYNTDFTSKADMESYEYCVSGSPAQDMMHMIECDPSEGSISTYYVNNINSTAGSSSKIMDLRFNRLGNFYIATVGFQGTKVNIGELWVTYQITLLKPKLYQAMGYADDFLKINTWGNGGLNETAPGYIASSNTTNGLFNNLSNWAMFNYSTMPFSGNVGSSSCWVYKSGAQKADIHFPVYPHKTWYQVIIAIATAVGAATPTFSLTSNYGDYDSRYRAQASGITGTVTGVVTNTYVFTFDVSVPGGFIPNYINTPFVTVISSAEIVNYNVDVYIMQRPVTGQNATFTSF